jgi:hypothetical protein
MVAYIVVPMHGHTNVKYKKHYLLYRSAFAENLCRWQKYNVTGLHVNRSICCPLKKKMSSSTDFYTSSHLSNLREIRPVGAAMIRAQRRTDVNDVASRLASRLCENT